jgi:hypothetical protein
MVNRLPRFSQNSYEQGQVAAGPFKKNLCKSRNLLTNRKKGVLLAALKKFLVHSIALGVKWIRTFKEEFKKLMNIWQTIYKLRPIQSYHF